MNLRTVFAGFAILSLAGVATVGLAARQPATQKASPKAADLVHLASPKTEGGIGLSEALARRRSIRSFTGRPLTQGQISQLCWAAQGITDERGYRTAPSAGATYPLRVYVAGPDGVFQYLPEGHALERLSSKDIRNGVAEASEQKWISRAGAIFLICGDVAITAAKYRDRATRYVWQETGHVAQNLLLQATALDLGATPVGATDDAALAALLDLPKPWQVMSVVPVGVPR
jgi:SagB-type dehydrogenase family enzyme